MAGLSKSVINTTVYYEKYGFQARVSNRKRSKFLGELAGFGLGRDFRYINGESIWDGQIGYDFQSGSLQGLSVLFQANNLTNEAFSAYEGENSAMLKNYENYGRTFLLGLRFNM
jgi:iron complex outermembrane receptor protein